MKALMKSLFTTILISGLVAGASVSHAAPVLSIDYSPDAQANFLAMLSGTSVTETFDSLGGATVNGGNQQSSWENKNTSFATDVGTFTLTQAGQTANGNVHNNQLMIESRTTGEFGREVLSNYRGDLWLDSNDAKKVVWTIDSAALAGGFFNALGFFIADPSDVSAILTLTFDDGSSTAQIKIFPKLPNATVGFVSLLSDKNIVGATFTFLNSTNNDGWGIDDVTIGKVPEPGTLLLLALGLLGLGIARRRVLSQH